MLKTVYVFKVFIESIESAKDGKQAPISRYTQPYSHCQLCCHYIEENRLDLAAIHLNSAKSFYSFEFRSRLRAQLRSIERRLKYRVTNQIEDTCL